MFSVSLLCLCCLSAYRVFLLCMFHCVNSFLFFGDVFFFKQKTAYEMRISDWSSDVCSSDLSNVMADPQNDKVLSADQRIATIARLNDALRQSIHNPGINQVVMTAGVADLIGDTILFRGDRTRVV